MMNIDNTRQIVLVIGLIVIAAIAAIVFLGIGLDVQMERVGNDNERGIIDNYSSISYGDSGDNLLVYVHDVPIHVDDEGKYYEVVVYPNAN